MNLSLDISDGAGNSDGYRTSIVVFDRVDITDAFWVGNVTLSAPLFIDRDLVTFYEPFMWKRVNFSTNIPDTKPQSIEVIGCITADPNGTIDDEVFLSGLPEVFNYNQFQFNPNTGFQNDPIDEVYVKFRLIQAAPQNVSSISVNCSFQIKGLLNRTTIVRAPPVNVTFNISYSENPFDSVQDAVDEEIEDIKDSWLVQAEWLDSLTKILDYANMVCGLFDTLIKIQAVWTGITDIWNALCDKWPASVAAIPAKISAGSATETVKEGTKEGWEGFGKKFCSMISCTYAYNDATNEKGFMNSLLNTITGNAGYTDKIAGSGRDRNAWLGNLSTDPKDSLLLSLLYLCIPGMIYNLQKARLIDCNYIKCLKQVENGMPISQCTSMRAYGFCKFVFGEIFNLIPFASVIAKIGEAISSALSDPAMLISFVASFACKFFCVAPKSPEGACSACTVLDYISLVMDLACDLGVGGGDSCPGVWENLEVERLGMHRGVGR